MAGRPFARLPDLAHTLGPARQVPQAAQFAAIGAQGNARGLGGGGGCFKRWVALLALADAGARAHVYREAVRRRLGLSDR